MAKRKKAQEDNQWSGKRNTTQKTKDCATFPAPLMTPVVLLLSDTNTNQMRNIRSIECYWSYVAT